MIASMFFSVLIDQPSYVPNRSNINWYIYILIWAIFNTDAYTIIVYKRAVKVSHVPCGWNVRSYNATQTISES